MINQFLLAHFNRISEAPNAIPRFRQFILDLAVHGTLVPQCPKDESTSDLLKQIKEDIDSKGASRDSTKLRSAIKIPIESLPFRIPQHWTWAPLTEVAEVSYGFAFESSHFNVNKQGMPLIRIRDISDNDTEAYYRGNFDHSYIVRTGDYLVGMDGDFNVRKWKGADALLNQRVMRIKNWHATLSPDFLAIPLQMVLDHLHISTSKTTVKHLSAKQVNGIYLPLPPVAEQRRIVAKLNELMSLCDRLEAAQGSRDERRDRFTAATHHFITDHSDPEVAGKRAAFYVNHLPELASRPQQIPAMREAILNLAVCGRITPQDASDEPVSHMLERIYSEQQRLIEAGAIPKSKNSLSDTFIELAFELPKSWEPIALGRLCNFVTSGSRGWAEYYSESGPKFIRAQNVRFGKLRLDDVACVNPPKRSEGTRTQVAKGDLLIVITGAGVTNPALLETDLGEAYVSQHVALIKPTDTSVSAWLLLCLMAPLGGRAELVTRAYGAGKPGLNLDNIRSLAIPLPPLAEQRRIVAKVNALMALCDHLENKLVAVQTESGRLLETVLHSALANA